MLKQDVFHVGAFEMSIMAKYYPLLAMMQVDYNSIQTAKVNMLNFCFLFYSIWSLDPNWMYCSIFVWYMCKANMFLVF